MATKSTLATAFVALLVLAHSAYVDYTLSAKIQQQQAEISVLTLQGQTGMMKAGFSMTALAAITIDKPSVYKRYLGLLEDISECETSSCVEFALGAGNVDYVEPKE